MSQRIIRTTETKCDRCGVKNDVAFDDLLSRGWTKVTFRQANAEDKYLDLCSVCTDAFTFFMKRADTVDLGKEVEHAE